MSPNPIKQKSQCEAIVKGPRWMPRRCANGAREGSRWCGVHIKTNGTIEPQTQFRPDSSEFFQKALVTLEEIYKTLDKHGYDGDKHPYEVSRAMDKVDDMICDIEEMMESDEE